MKNKLDTPGGRGLTAAVALLALAYAAPVQAGSTDLWISFFNGDGIQAYTSKELNKSGMPTPTLLNTFEDALGLAFDHSKNLWAVVEVSNVSQVVEFTAAQLKKLKTDPNPTPAVTITSSTFDNLGACNFDKQGNLWVVGSNGPGPDGYLYELSKSQLTAGSADITPVIFISFVEFAPSYFTFDKEGNAWVSPFNDQIVEFSASQLTSGGSKTPAVVLTDDGSTTSLSDPGEIAFDKKGNLWVPNFDANTVAEYSKDQLKSSGDPAPAVKLTSSALDHPVGALFNDAGDLVIMNFSNGTIEEFTPKQLKESGSPVPKVSVTGTGTVVNQIIFGPAS